MNSGRSMVVAASALAILASALGGCGGQSTTSGTQGAQGGGGDYASQVDVSIRQCSDASQYGSPTVQVTNNSDELLWVMGTVTYMDSGSVQVDSTNFSATVPAGGTALTEGMHGTDYGFVDCEVIGVQAYPK